MHATAIMLTCRPDVAAAKRLFPWSQYLCRSAILVPSFAARLHHATLSPSEKAKRKVILVIVEAIARYTVGCQVQVRRGWPSEILRTAMEAPTPIKATSNAPNPCHGSRHTGLTRQGFRGLVSTALWAYEVNPGLWAVSISRGGSSKLRERLSRRFVSL